MNPGRATPLLLIGLLWAAGLGAAGQFAKVSVIFDQLADLYPGVGASLGFLVSLISLMGIFGGLYAGVLIARTGFRRMLLLALVLGAAVSFWQSMLPGLGWLFLSRVVEGLSHLAIVVCAPTLIGVLAAPGHRAAAMTLWSTFFGVAFAVVGYLGLPLVDAFGVEALFLAHGLYMLAVALVLWAVLPAEDGPVGAVPPLSWADIWSQHKEIYRSPHQSAPALGWLFYTMTFVAVLTVLPMTIAPEAQRTVLSAMPLASLCMSLTVGLFLLQRVPAVRVVQLGFALALMVVFIGDVFAGSTWVPILLLATLGLVQGASFAAIPQLNGTTETQAHANGAMAQMGNLGNMIGTPLLLAMIGALGDRGITVFLGLSFVAGLLVHVLQAQRRRREIA